MFQPSPKAIRLYIQHPNLQKVYLKVTSQHPLSQPKVLMMLLQRVQNVQILLQTQRTANLLIPTFT